MKSSLSGKTVIATNGLRYLIKNSIGMGGYGIVFMAIDINSGGIVAIKTIRSSKSFSLNRQAQHVSCFQKEIDHCSRLHHINIVKLLNSGIMDDGNPFVVFEYVKGIGLKDFILMDRHHLPIKSVILQLLEALEASHRKGIIHGDLKPQNVMLIKEEHEYIVKLFDYGCSIEIHADEEIANSNRQPTTANYCAPEQLRHNKPTIKSDIYSWGLILLECLTARPGIEGRTLSSVIKNQLDDAEIMLPKQLSNKALRQLLREVLTKNADHRLGDIAIIRERFSEIDLTNLEYAPKIDLPLNVISPKDQTRINTIKRLF